MVLFSGGFFSRGVRCSVLQVCSRLSHTSLHTLVKIPDRLEKISGFFVLLKTGLNLGNYYYKIIVKILN